MPGQSSTSSIRKWPDRARVEESVATWAQQVARDDPSVTRLGFAGSYARGDWGVGSDVDLVIVVASSEEPFTERSRKYDATGLPVPADVVVYTEKEWDELRSRSRAFEEVVWVFPPAPRTRRSQ